MTQMVSPLAVPTSSSLGDVPFSQPIAFDIEQLCDGLEQRGFVHLNGLFSDELLSALHGEIALLDENYALQRAGIGRGSDHLLEKTIRTDKIHWLMGDTLAQCQFQKKLEELRIAINRRLMLGLFASESMYAVYREGDFYKKHLDSFKGEKNRILSMVLYLNPIWEAQWGGLLDVYADEQALMPFAHVAPHFGDMVLFLSEDIPHEVTPTTVNRYSIATWFRCNHENPLLQVL